MKNKQHTGALWAIFALGIGLALAPVVFQMFSRAPAGGVMIDEFAQYMTEDEVDQFRGYMEVISRADAESVDVLQADLDAWGALPVEARLTALTNLNEEWPAIDADMTDLLNRMEANLGNYNAVAALPPFNLFPWFFVLPGLLIAGLAAYTIRATKHGRPIKRQLWALTAVGIAVVMAPAVFQMFSRAPAGADMIDDFRPMMTRERVLDVQSYFVTMGAAEGQLRTAAVPLAVEAGEVEADERYPAISDLSEDWPTIVGDFSPMVATMSDNVDNFAGIDALPPFGLFPWFFVGPGLLVAGLALAAGRRRPNATGELDPPHTASATPAAPSPQPSISRSAS